MQERRRCPVQRCRRISLAWARAVQAAAKVHIYPGTGVAFLFTQRTVGSQCISMMRCLRDRPGIAGSPAFGFWDDVAKAWAVKNARFSSLEPLVEPRERFDVKALPRPREPMVSHHRNLQMFAVVQPLISL